MRLKEIKREGKISERKERNVKEADNEEKNNEVRKE